MARPRQRKSFEKERIANTFWEVINSDGEIVVYVSCGTGRNFYYCNKDRIVLKDGFGSMQQAFEGFVSLLNSAEHLP